MGSRQFIASPHWCFKAEVNGEKNKIGHFNDDETQQSIEPERRKWQEVRKFASRSFLCKNNPPFKDSNKKLGSPNVGDFLDIIDVINKYNRALKKTISKHKTGSAK